MEDKEVLKTLKCRLAAIKSRCTNKNSFDYIFYYGGRGVKNYLDLNDLIFLWDRDNAIKMKKPTIDRIDPSGHYEIKNCRFIERSENSARVRRSAFPLVKKKCPFCRRTFMCIRQDKFCNKECRLSWWRFEAKMQARKRARIKHKEQNQK